MRSVLLRGRVQGGETYYPDGSTLKLVEIIDEGGDHLHLLIHDPKWNLSTGRNVPITIDFDEEGDEFTGTAKAVDRTTLDLQIDSRPFVADFKRDYGADLYVLGAHWSVSLYGTFVTLESL